MVSSPGPQPLFIFDPEYLRVIILSCSRSADLFACANRPNRLKPTSDFVSICHAMKGSNAPYPEWAVQSQADDD